MRFLSKHDGFGLNVQDEIPEHYATGQSRILQPHIAAYFKNDVLRPHEREFALAHFQFRGLYQELDEATTVPPDYRIGVFDSVLAAEQNGWSDEERELVEKALIEHAEKFNDVLVAPRASVEPPWPRYDAYQGTHQKLCQKLIAEGHDIARVLIYERETQNRPQVVEALEELLVDPNAIKELAKEETILA